MKRLGSNLWIAVLTVLVAGGISARANTINGAPSGLASPAETIDFSEIPLAPNSPVTNQYAAFGITFSPNVYYNPQGGTAFGLPANDVGNFTFPTEPAFVNPVTIDFSTMQNGAALMMAANDTPYMFVALDGGVPVDAFIANSVGVPGLFYGFSGEAFNQIEILQAGPGGGPYWLASNIQLSNAPAVATTPEPASTLLFVGVGLAMLASFGGTLRRRLALPPV